MTAGSACTGRAGKKAAPIQTAVAVQQSKMTHFSSAIIMKIKRIPHLLRSAEIALRARFSLYRVVYKGGYARRGIAEGA